MDQRWGEAGCAEQRPAEEVKITESSKEDMVCLDSGGICISSTCGDCHQTLEKVHLSCWSRTWGWGLRILTSLFSGPLPTSGVSQVWTPPWHLLVFRSQVESPMSKWWDLAKSSVLMKAPRHHLQESHRVFFGSYCWCLRLFSAEMGRHGAEGDPGHELWLLFFLLLSSIQFLLTENVLFKKVECFHFKSENVCKHYM